MKKSTFWKIYKFCWKLEKIFLMVLKLISNKKVTLMSHTTPYIAPDTTSRHSRSWTSKFNENFTEEIRNDEKNINSEIFKKYFRYQNSSVLA